MKNVILNVTINELNWKEKIIVKVFRKTFTKVYGIAGKRTFNDLIS